MEPENTKEQPPEKKEEKKPERKDDVHYDDMRSRNDAKERREGGRP